MTPERWQQVKELLGDVLELPAAEQDAWLARSCAGDEGLRKQARALLALRRESVDFLETPAASLLPAEPQAPVTQQRIGPYKLVRRIGRGGMGKVYLAVRDTKEVAIKLLERGTDCEAIVRRFETERQILAQLEHPGIARFLDGGCDDDRPYFVMEYVEGERVDLYCDRHGLSVRYRLELFRQICSAVAFAHRNLVVHCDLKPANILVSARGEPKLLDFGIAKLLAPSNAGGEESGISRRAMTPAYASPEQLRGGPITTASDVFSLGVLLHELLTGERPPRSGLHLISTCLGRLRPSQVTQWRNAGITPCLDGDLDGIVSEALALKTVARYSSVERLSGDIGRYLGGLPILVRAGKPGHRAG